MAARGLGLLALLVHAQNSLDAAEPYCLRVTMISATQSNRGASAYFGFLYAFAGNLDLLTADCLADRGLRDRTRGVSARLFCWEFRQRRRDELRLLPHALRRRLLAHAVHSNDNDKTERARAAFGVTSARCRPAWPVSGSSCFSSPLLLPAGSGGAEARSGFIELGTQTQTDAGVREGRAGSWRQHVTVDASDPNAFRFRQRLVVPNSRRGPLSRTVRQRRRMIARSPSPTTRTSTSTSGPQITAVNRPVDGSHRLSSLRTMLLPDTPGRGMS